jgi:hypothetical protein
MVVQAFLSLIGAIMIQTSYEDFVDDSVKSLNQSINHETGALEFAKQQVLYWQEMVNKHNKNINTYKANKEECLSWVKK